MDQKVNDAAVALRVAIADPANQIDTEPTMAATEPGYANRIAVKTAVVIDGLLDIRNVAEPAFQLAVDGALNKVGGRHLMPIVDAVALIDSIAPVTAAAKDLVTA